MVVVAVSGLHGAGKTTVARAVAKKLGFDYACAGEAFRQLAKESGMTLDDFSRYAERRPAIDRRIDERTIRTARKGNSLIDARLAGWMAKGADLKILLAAPLEVRAERIAKRERRSVKDVLGETVARERSETKRFKRLYGIDPTDHSVFDLVLNTERLSAREVIRIIESAIEAVGKGKRR